MTTFDLRTARLRPGEQFRDSRHVALEALEFGGERYFPVPESPEAVLTLTRTTTGVVLELELGVNVVGPCMRCLADASVPIHVASREYHARTPDEGDELQTPYVVDDRVDLSAWTRDAIVLALPDKILCREDCAGLCPVCGRDLNRDPHEHEGEAFDPRWAALSKLRDEL